MRGQVKDGAVATRSLREIALRKSVRLLNSHRSQLLLRLYERILREKEVIAEDSPPEKELLLSGLVIKDQGRLRIHNPIYRAIFNLDWLVCSSNL